LARGLRGGEGADQVGMQSPTVLSTSHERRTNAHTLAKTPSGIADKGAHFSPE